MDLKLLIDCIDAVQSVLKKELEKKNQQLPFCETFFSKKKKEKFEKKEEKNKEKPEEKDEDDEKKFDKERAHFIKNTLVPLSVQYKFKDGEDATVVSSLPRKLWPPKQNGEKYSKVQELCEDFKIEFKSDGGPNIYILVPEME